MNKHKRIVLVGLHIVIVAATVAATIIMLLHPACIEHMLAEVARGVAAGLLLALVKVMVEVSRPTVACKPLSCWWAYGRTVAWHDLKCGLVSGYLLGLVIAMWSCWNG